MAYNAEQDSYTCANGKAITFDYVKKQKSSSGYEAEVSVYSCKDCDGCPLKEKCLRGNSKKPLEERSKVLYVSKKFIRQRFEKYSTSHIACKEALPQFSVFRCFETTPGFIGCVLRFRRNQPVVK